MANVFIIHGVEGYPEESWFPWLKEELEKLGYKVFVPQFPTPENQTLSNWYFQSKSLISRTKERGHPLI